MLLCNPRAGGRWRELASILDSQEATFARRIVTDSVEDVAAALADLEADTRLVCVYGGDGTIQRVLDRLTASELEGVTLALLGGGTMNVTSRWLGMTATPASNFKYAVRAYRRAELLHREVPVLVVRAGDERYRCFTFGMGPIVRLLDAYERGRKGKVAAVGVAARAMSAVWLGWPGSFKQLLAPMKARVSLDGEVLPDDEFVALFANVTGQINPGVEPFKHEVRARDGFHCAAYAVSPRELTAALPMLIRGWLPVDVRQLLSRGFDDNGDGEGWQARLPTDPRYVNRVVKELSIETDERLYTVDGEVLQTEAPINVRIGPTLKLAVGPRMPERVKLAAESAVKR